MTKKWYVGVSDIARNVSKGYVGVGTKSYQSNLSSSDFQKGAILYQNGVINTTDFTSNYVYSPNFYNATYGNKIEVTCNYTPLSDSGFIWYDSNKSFISGNPGTISGNKIIGYVPQNAHYFRFNINASGITPQSITSCSILVDSTAHQIIKGYVGVNGVAQLFFDNSISELTVTFSVGTTKYTIPDWANYAIITACAGGGGGGGDGYTGSQTGGGGGGEAIQNKQFNVSSLKGQTITIVVGKGGAGGRRASTGNNSKGKDGENTVIGSIVTLNGGKGSINDGLAGGPGGGDGGRGVSGYMNGADGEAGITGAGGKGGPGDESDYPYYGGCGGGGSLGNGGDGGSGYASYSTLSTYGKSGTRGGGGGGAGQSVSISHAGAGGNGGNGYAMITWKKNI